MPRTLRPMSDANTSPYLRRGALRVERAHYDAARGERAFHQCDPDNRLVARSLETRWEHTLRELNSYGGSVVKPGPVGFRR